MAVSDAVSNLIKNPFLLNLLAQQGYSTTPGPGPLGVIGRAGLATAEQNQKQQELDIRNKLIESRLGKTTNPFGAIDPSKFTQESIAKFGQSKDYGDLVLRPDSGTNPSAVQEFQFYQSLSPEQQAEFLKVKRSQPFTSVPGAGYGAPNLATGEFQPSIPEPMIVSGTNVRAAAEGEGSRGNIMGGGGFTPAPGSKAEAERRVIEKQDAIRAQQQSTQAQTVAEDVQRLNTLISEDKVPFGRTAALQESLSPVLQSDGYRNADALIKSVQGNVGVDQLINIKKQGSGLGQVPQQQLNLLSRLLGELTLNQSREQFIRTWNRTGEVYNEIWRQADTELTGLGRPTPDVFKRIDVKSGEETQKVIDFNDLPQ